jgi:predicted negative regulator of RcsB-dependent stress response
LFRSISRDEQARRAAVLAVLGGLMLALTMPAARGQDRASGAGPGEGPVAGFGFTRKVSVSGSPAVVVSEFLTHGAREGTASKAVAVVDRAGQLVPWRVLQEGPGDLLRLAFQTGGRGGEFRIAYGGTAAKPPSPPEWKDGPGLEVETRAFQNCDMNRLDSVRAAFEKASPMGSDFVPAVFHRFNPTNPAPAPFMSLYRGTLRVPAAGTHAFFTSSQDCSFLLIDGKLVVSSGGAHGPAGHARFKGEAKLSAGPHAFEYLHAAAGPDACMVAAWQPQGAAKPEPIPPAAFGSERVERVTPGHPTTADGRIVRDVVYQVQGEVPLEGADDAPLVRVQFQDASGRSSSRLRWDFGDGQTSSSAAPTHVFPRPGVYTVTLSEIGGAGPVVNRVPVSRAIVIEDASRPPDSLASYLAMLEGYDPARMDGPGALALVRAMFQGGQPARGVAAAKTWLEAEGASRDDPSVRAVAELAATALRDGTNDPKSARVIWELAAKASTGAAAKAASSVEAADLALNMLLDTNSAGRLLDEAETASKDSNDPLVAARIARVRGDLLARKGDRAGALASYQKAAQMRPTTRGVVERQAWRGGFNRSVEAFVREKKLDRALESLRAWQDEFPGDKAEGTLSFLLARAWAAGGAYDRAIAVAGDLLAVNPDSASADRLALLAADCEEQRGETARAVASLQAILTDYPGSPLVPEVRKRLSRLQGPPATDSSPESTSNPM